jgi:hypothetical protein
MIEFHLDLEGEGEEFASGHCWLPDKICEIISTAKEGLAADGNSKKEPAPIELSDRNWRSDPSDGLRPLKLIRNTFTHE